MPDETTLIIVPTYNERDNLPRIVERLMALPIPPDVLVVDDNSPDGTGQIADALAAVNPRVHVLHRAVKDGLGRAYVAGFQWALARGYEFIFEMDADFSHNPADIPRFLEAARSDDADLVLGTRYRNGIRVINWPLNRLLLSLAAGHYVRLITGMPVSDPTGGFKCFRRRALIALNPETVRSNGYSFQIELTHRVWRRGGRISEVPIIFTDRFLGSSKMSRAIVREALWMVWKLWIENALQRHPRPPVDPA
jgi:dolichol-phosphate mannosyltransferase